MTLNTRFYSTHGYYSLRDGEWLWIDLYMCYSVFCFLFALSLTHVHIFLQTFPFPHTHTNKSTDTGMSTLTPGD